MVTFTNTHTKILNKQFRYTLDVNISKETGDKIRFRHTKIKSWKIRFGHPIILISPNSRHTPFKPNLKWVHLNATPSRRLFVTKPASQEASL